MIQRLLLILSTAFMLSLVPACGKKCCGDTCETEQAQHSDEKELK